MGLYYDSMENDRDYALPYNCNHQYIDKYNKIMESNLSMLKLWISIAGENINIKPRANNIFYSDCIFHRATDLPVCINENKKAFFCYGCGEGGSLVLLVSKCFHISAASTIDILFSIVNKDLGDLSKRQLKIAKRILKKYNSPVAEHYFKISNEKTNYINKRIESYIQKNGDSQETIKKMRKRLCTKYKISRSNIYNDLPF